MRMLLTGGTGFIGSRLALIARERGLDVRTIGQVNTASEEFRRKLLEKAGVNLETGDLRDPAVARRAVESCDVVMHLAAAQHEANVPDSYFRDLNVGGTRNLLEASRQAGVSRFVFGSTIGVYGSAGDSGTLDESSPTRPANIYGQSKLEAEAVVREFGATLPITIVRISETYGPGDIRLLKLFRAISAGTFMIVGSGLNKRQLIHVDDLSRGLLAAMETPAARGETFVIAGKEVLTTRDMVEQIALALGRSPPRLRLPLWPFMTAAIVFEHTLKPMGIQPPLYRRRLDFFTKSYLFSTAKASRVLNHKPQIAFRDGARQVAQWYRDNGLLKRAV